MTKVSKQAFAKAIPGTGGIVSEIARKLSITRQACYLRLQDPALAEALEQERQATLDRCESKLLQLIDDGDSSAIKFYLSTIGKVRGYTTRQEVNAEVNSVSRAQVIISLPSNGRDPDLYPSEE